MDRLAELDREAAVTEFDDGPIYLAVDERLAHERHKPSVSQADRPSSERDTESGVKSLSRQYDIVKA